MPIGLIENLVHCTVRIETTLRNGFGASGTGFFMEFLKNGDNRVPVIVTNKHVIKDSVEGRFHLTIRRPDGEPDIGNHQLFKFHDFESMWVGHPDPNVDLAVFLIGPLLTAIDKKGVRAFFTMLNKELIPSQDERDDYSSMEDIVMLGYPSGIWDAKNNLPVIRRGITATHCGIDWNGKTEFLTDIASFPGSSGSPVLLANLNGYVDRKGNAFFGTPRIKLLGVHYAGAQHTAEGKIIIVQAPTSAVPIPTTNIPNNIGVVINSMRILEFESLLLEKYFGATRIGIQPLRNSPCRCGSGKKFKQCCGALL